ncbi:hypothetical protein M409DRAFT_61357 [Zasmidium cellare ATCC 36951]|uniref:Uncharacterized protein n=1 Tax=Zasmidium cellare ATCC 36951 TaxID=1080233 RepID=A0A6A6BXI9_ZASCE|nr:uncharacterized protein M409DRAFT_61357 [Zasmidium cellare ATCC 36951]KAF2158768.1 hypothetical protein M409DRAFT_61357 [Zasmidium cellare ATCC 36951]
MDLLAMAARGGWEVMLLVAVVMGAGGISDNAFGFPKSRKRSEVGGLQARAGCSAQSSASRDKSRAVLGPRTFHAHIPVESARLLRPHTYEPAHPLSPHNLTPTHALDPHTLWVRTPSRPHTLWVRTPFTPTHLPARAPFESPSPLRPHSPWVRTPFESAYLYVPHILYAHNTYELAHLLSPHIVDANTPQLYSAMNNPAEGSLISQVAED